MEMQTESKTLVPSFREAIWFWCKMGFLSFGGPAGQIAMMYSELVEKKKWMENKDFQSCLQFCLLLPGPEAMQLAIYLGNRLFGYRGGVLAGVFFVLPSIVSIALLSVLYSMFGKVIGFQSFLFGMKLGVISILLFSIAKMIEKFKNSLSSPTQESETSQSSKLPSFRDLAIGFLLIALPYFTMILFEVLPIWKQMSVFYFKTALITFGGAYAVLPYVSHQVVHVFFWLTEGQVLDALALGETTPGPLIIVLSFIGYMTTFQNVAPNIGTGLLGLSVVTYYSFLPSFLFVLFLSPFYEGFRNHRWFVILPRFLFPFILLFLLGLTWQLIDHCLQNLDWTNLISYCYILSVLVCLYLLLKKNIDVVWIVLGSGFIGFTSSQISLPI